MLKEQIAGAAGDVAALNELLKKPMSKLGFKLRVHLETKEAPSGRGFFDSRKLSSECCLALHQEINDAADDDDKRVRRAATQAQTGMSGQGETDGRYWPLKAHSRCWRRR